MEDIVAGKSYEYYTNSPQKVLISLTCNRLISPATSKKELQHQVYHSSFTTIDLYEFTFLVCMKFKLLAQCIHSPFLFRASDVITNAVLVQISFLH